MLPIFVHPYRFQAFLYPLPYFFRRYTHIFRPKPYILFHNLTDNLVIRVLKNHPCILPYFPQIFFFDRILPVYPYGSFRRIKDCVQMLCQCRFPRTIMPKDSHKIPLLYIQIYLIHRTGNALDIPFFISSDIFKNKLFRFYNSHLPPYL